MCLSFDTAPFLFMQIDVNTPRFEANKEGISLNYL